MSSRRSGKTGRTLLDGSTPMTMEEAAELTYGDYALVDEADRNRIFRHPVHPNDLKIDPAIQVRIKPNPARVEELKQVLLNGGHFKDPIRAFRDDEGNLWLSAGFRRTDATRQALLEAPSGVEIAPLICEDCPGGRAAAMEDAESDNLKHGEPLSTEEKRGIFERRWQRRHEWFADNWSNNQIAAELAVSEGTIRNWRKAIVSLTSQNYEVGENEGEKQPQKRTVQRGGETYQMKTSKIGQTAQKRTKRGSSHKVSRLIPDVDRPAEPPADSDQPAQPRGLYQDHTSQVWTPRAPAGQVSVEDDPDGQPLTEAQIKRAVLEHLQAAAAGLRDLDLQEDADNLLEYIRERREEWGLAREEEN